MASKKVVQTPLVCHGHTRPIVELQFRCGAGHPALPGYRPALQGCHQGMGGHGMEPGVRPPPGRLRAGRKRRPSLCRPPAAAP